MSWPLSLSLLLSLLSLSVSVNGAIVKKTSAPLPSGDVEVTLSFQLESKMEKVFDVTYHDSLPVHVELKDGNLVGALNVDFSASSPTLVKYTVYSVGIDLGLNNRSISVPLPSATFSFRRPNSAERTQVKTNPSEATFTLSLPRGEKEYPELLAFITLVLPVISALFSIKYLVSSPPEPAPKTKKK